MNRKPNKSTKVGDTYGRLTVIEFSHSNKRWERYWKCRCSCGKDKLVNQSALHQGTIKSCGCLRNQRASETNRLNLTGKRFGKLVALEYVGSHRTCKKSTSAKWKCKCDCGEEKITTSHNLMFGTVISCGCANKYKDKTKAAMHLVLNRYKCFCKKRKIEFKLDEDKFRKITSSNCHYCGASPSKTKKTESGSTYNFNGIDKIDPNKGYTEDNIVPCCWRCNTSKSDMSLNEFKQHVKNIYNNFIKSSSEDGAL